MDKDGLLIDFWMKKFFLFNIKVNCLSIYLTAEKLFSKQEINCNVVFFIQTKYSIKMENKFFKVNSFTNEIGTKQSLFLTRLGDFEGIARFLGGRGGGGGSLSLVLKFPGGNVENWLPINCNWGNKYGGNPKNYLYLDTLIISLPEFLIITRLSFYQKQMEQFRHQVLLMSAAWSELGKQYLQNEIGTARWNSKIHS